MFSGTYDNFLNFLGNERKSQLKNKIFGLEMVVTKTTTYSSNDPILILFQFGLRENGQFGLGAVDFVFGSRPNKMPSCTKVVVDKRVQ